MTKIQHLQFLLLMLPTFALLVAAVVCMADLTLPSDPQPQVVLVDPAYEVLQNQP